MDSDQEVVNDVIGPIVIRYDGLDAERHQIDLEQLGESLKGAARLVSVAGNIAVTGKYVSKMPAMALRAFAGIPQQNCYEILIYLSPSSLGLALMSEAGKIARKKVVESIVNYFLKRLGGSKSGESEKALELAKSAIEANKEVSIKSIEAVSEIARAALEVRPAARAFAAPVGRSASTALIGDPKTAVIVDARVKENLDAAEPVEIGPSSNYRIRISELDVETGSCKVTLDRGDDDHRVNGHVTDPIVNQPHNPYSAALDSQQWITVIAKPHIREGTLEKLSISDVRASDAA